VLLNVWNGLRIQLIDATLCSMRCVDQLNPQSKADVQAVR